jgi:hypothetical protein
MTKAFEIMQKIATIRVDLPFSEIQLAKKRSASKETDVTGNALIAGGAPVAGVAAARSVYQASIDPKAIHVVGGTSGDIQVGQKTYKTVFNTQRHEWADLARESGFKVNEYGRNVNAKIKTVSIPMPFNSAVQRDSKYSRPLVTLHVGNGPNAEAKSFLKDKLVGGINYRVFSDLGPGNQKQPRYDLASAQKNMMSASKGKWYKRNIVPGGDIIPGTISAQKDNINVTAIPTSARHWEASTPNVSKKKLVSVSFGSGYGWQKSKFPHHEKMMEEIIGGLNEHYGKDNYSLSVLGGPNTSTDFDMYFKGLERKLGKDYTYGRKSSQKGFMNLVTKSDLHIMGPGSSISEIAALKGHKPKIITFIPEASTSAHMRDNTEWAKKILGAVEEVFLDKDFNRAKMRGALDAVEKKTHLMSSHSVAANAEDIGKIIGAAKADLAVSKLMTKKLAIGAGTAIVTGAALKGISYLTGGHERK